MTILLLLTAKHRRLPLAGVQQPATILEYRYQGIEGNFKALSLVYKLAGKFGSLRCA